MIISLVVMNLLTPPLPVLSAMIFAVGICVGSFLNVCIWRIPAEEQIVRGRSHCRSCKKTILWYDNLPLVSFCLLKGRCRFCNSKISWQYPIVELVTGLLFVGLLLRFGFSDLMFAYLLLTAALIVLAVIDLKEMILPDQITLSGLSVGIILSFFIPALHGTTEGWSALWSGVVGALAGGGVLWVIGALGTMAFKREAMGQGDVKMMAMVGSVLGLGKVLLVALALGPLIGSIIGIFLKARFKMDLIPYGPFLALGTLITLFWGDALIGWYMTILRGY